MLAGRCEVLPFECFNVLQDKKLLEKIKADKKRQEELRQKQGDKKSGQKKSKKGKAKTKVETDRPGAKKCSNDEEKGGQEDIGTKLPSHCVVTGVVNPPAGSDQAAPEPSAPIDFSRVSVIKKDREQDVEEEKKKGKKKKAKASNTLTLDEFIGVKTYENDFPANSYQAR